jgi:hypothetical protein
VLWSKCLGWAVALRLPSSSGGKLTNRLICWNQN